MEAAARFCAWMGTVQPITWMPLAAMQLASLPTATFAIDKVLGVRIAGPAGGGCAALGGQMVPFGSVILLPTPIFHGDP
jgi:hypothetical protein